jgi:hypothetical protein
MEVRFSCETSESTFKVLRCHNQEDHALNNHCRQNLKISTVGILMAYKVQLFRPIYSSISLSDKMKVRLWDHHAVFVYLVYVCVYVCFTSTNNFCIYVTISFQSICLKNDVWNNEGL